MLRTLAFSCSLIARPAASSADLLIRLPLASFSTLPCRADWFARRLRCAFTADMFVLILIPILNLLQRICFSRHPVLCLLVPAATGEASPGLSRSASLAPHLTRHAILLGAPRIVFSSLQLVAVCERMTRCRMCVRLFRIYEIVIF